MSVQVTSLPTGLAVVTETAPHVKTAAIGVFVGCGVSLRARGRARAFAFHRAYGVQGHSPSKRPRDRRDDRERWRRPQRRDRSRADKLFRPCSGERRSSRARRHWRPSHRQRVRPRGARTREERHRPGNRGGRRYARRPGVRSPHRDRLAGPADRPADPRHAGEHRGLRPGGDRGLSQPPL